eukprot:jgi/Tetstr1/443915/TSEL_031867.t1
MHLAYAATFDPYVYVRKPSIRLLLPSTRSTPPHAEEPPDLRRAPPSWGANANEIKDLDVPSWRMWMNRCLAGRCHSRTAAFLASGTVVALHKDDFAANEERAKTYAPAFRQEGVSGANTHDSAHEAPAAGRSDSNGTRTRIFARISHQGAVGCVKRTSPSRIST